MARDAGAASGGAASGGDLERLRERFFELLDGERPRDAQRLAEEVLERLGERARRSPIGGEWNLYLAIAASERERHRTARACLIEAIAALEKTPGPLLVEALHRRALRLEDRGLHRTAKPIWTQALKTAHAHLDKSDPVRIELMIDAAVSAAIRAVTWTLARECLKALRPDHEPDLRIQVAELFLAIGRDGASHDMAPEWLEDALAIVEATPAADVDVARFATALGLSLLPQDRWQEAAAAYRRAIAWAEKAPAKRARALYLSLANLAPALREAGDLPGAAAALERALALEPTAEGALETPLRAFARVCLGEVRLAQERAADARREFETALALLEEARDEVEDEREPPHVARAHFGLGRALGALGDREGARASFVRARKAYAEDGDELDLGMVERCDEELAGLEGRDGEASGGKASGGKASGAPKKGAKGRKGKKKGS